MLPTLRHIPKRSIIRIPGPKAIGSRKATVTWGLSPNGVLPDGNDLVTWVSSFGTPIWYAVTDNGAGFIPWGFWQVAVYPLGESPGGGNLAFTTREVPSETPPSAMAGAIFSGFEQLQSQAVSAGFKHAADMRLSVQQITSGDPFDSVRIVAPYGVQLQGFFSGPLHNVGENFYQVERTIPGYDNPLVLALWSPGNRALIHARTAPPSGLYPYYPYYPQNPPPPVIIG